MIVLNFDSNDDLKKQIFIKNIPENYYIMIYKGKAYIDSLKQNLINILENNDDAIINLIYNFVFNNYSRINLTAYCGVDQFLINKLIINLCDKSKISLKNNENYFIIKDILIDTGAQTSLIYIDDEIILNKNINKTKVTGINNQDMEVYSCFLEIQINDNFKIINDFKLKLKENILNVENKNTMFEEKWNIINKREYNILGMDILKYTICEFSIDGFILKPNYNFSKIFKQ